MLTNPHRHHRRSPRLRGYDYTRAGRYFVTICAEDRLCLFGGVVEGRMHLNAWGQVADEEWRRTANLRDNVRLDAYVAMPNHVHGVISIVDGRRRGCSDMARHVATTVKQRQFVKPIAALLSTIVGAYKSTVTKRINRCDTTGSGESVWQPRFGACPERSRRNRIIRNARWNEDRLHP